MINSIPWVKGRLTASSIEGAIVYDLDPNAHIPQGLSSKLSKRDLEIYAKFNGTNHNQLVKEYHVSVVWIDALVKRVYQEEVRKKQGDLF